MLEEVITRVLEGGGLYGIAAVVFAYWGWNRSKAVDDLQEKRIEDVRMLVKTAQDVASASDKVADALNNLRIRLEQRGDK